MQPEVQAHGALCAMLGLGHLWWSCQNLWRGEGDALRGQDTGTHETRAWPGPSATLPCQSQQPPGHQAECFKGPSLLGAVLGSRTHRLYPCGEAEQWPHIVPTSQSSTASRSRVPQTLDAEGPRQQGGASCDLVWLGALPGRPMSILVAALIWYLSPRCGACPTPAHSGVQVAVCCRRPPPLELSCPASDHSPC